SQRRRDGGGRQHDLRPRRYERGHTGPHGPGLPRAGLSLRLTPGQPQEVSMSVLSTMRNSLRGPRRPRRSEQAASGRLSRRLMLELLEDRTCPSGSWTSLAPMPTQRYALSAAADSSAGLVYALGGQTGVCPDATSNEVYNPAANSWATRAPLPTPHAYGGA